MSWQHLEQRISHHIDGEFFDCDGDWASVRQLVHEEYPSLPDNVVERVVSDCCAEMYIPSPRDLFLDTLHRKLESVSQG